VSNPVTGILQRASSLKHTVGPYRCPSPIAIFDLTTTSFLPGSESLVSRTLWMKHDSQYTFRDQRKVDRRDDV
jgi:hypothetical protein